MRDMKQNHVLTFSISCIELCLASLKVFHSSSHTQSTVLLNPPGRAMPHNPQRTHPHLQPKKAIALLPNTKPTQSKATAGGNHLKHTRFWYKLTITLTLLSSISNSRPVFLRFSSNSFLLSCGKINQ